MEITTDRYVDHEGWNHIDFSFWDGDQQNLGHVLFVGNPAHGAFNDPWTAGVFLGGDKQYAHHAKFGFTPGRPLNEIVSERVKKTIGMVGWMMLEEAYERAFSSSKVRGNPALDPSWSESVLYKRLEKSDHVRGGTREIVWLLSWVDAPLDSPIGTRAAEYMLLRELGPLQFNERMLRTTFVAGVDTTKIKDGWGGWGKYGTDRYASFYGDDLRSLDEEDLRKIGVAGYMILQRMMERVRELEVSGKKKRR